jgi:hypothetical protein
VVHAPEDGLDGDCFHPLAGRKRNILLSGRVVNSLIGYFTDPRLGMHGDRHGLRS